MKSKFFLVLWMLLISNTLLLHAESLYVGQSCWLDGPDYSGIMDAISWYSDHNNEISISGNASGANVIIQSYFSGTATIECQYAYHYYVGSKRQNMTGHLRWTVSCLKSTTTLTQTTLVLAPGETATLAIKSNSSGYKVPFPVWTVEDQKIATVDDSYRTYGVESITVKGVNPGATTITLGAGTGGENPTCKVMVKDIPATGLKLNPEKLTLSAGKKGSFTTIFTPSNASSSITWSINNESVASISNNGLVTAVKEGTAIVKATTENGIVATGTVEVLPVPESVSLIDPGIIYVGYSRTLEPQVFPTNSVTTFKWISSNKSIATVDSNGSIRGVSPGRTTITVSTDNGKSASIDVMVEEISEDLNYLKTSSRIKVITEVLTTTLNY